MKASNQKERTTELLKFIGLMFSLFLLTSFVLYSNISIPKSENKNLKKENEALKAQLEEYRISQKRLASITYYADSALGMIDRLAELETSLRQFQAQNAGFEQTMEFQVTFKPRLTQSLREINTALLLLQNSDRDTTRNAPMNQLVGQIQNSFMGILNAIQNEKQVKLSAYSGQIAAIADQEKAELERQLQEAQKRNEQQQIQMQYNTQQQAIQTQLEQTQGKYSECFTNLNSLRTQLTSAKTQLAIDNDALGIESSRITLKSTELRTIINEIGGLRDRQEKARLENLVTEFNSISQNLQKISTNLNGLQAGLN